MPRRVIRIRKVGRYLSPVGDEFVSVEALSGIVVLIAAIVSLAWVNISPDSFDEVWGRSLTLGAGNATITLDIRHWLNDGLMTLFFFVVGLEIKRELAVGELRDPRTASLSIVAAIGGMVLPALIFVSFTAGGGGARGWGIPIATDIALAVGVLALLGNVVPRRLKLFLLTLAIADDIGAIVVIAVFYSEGFDARWIAGAVVICGVILGMRRITTSPIPYVIPAAALWLCFHESGVHATIAGVALGLLTPASPLRGRRVIEGLEHRFHPFSSFLIVPLFTLANAGVRLDTDVLGAAASNEIGLGIVLGLVVGKTCGVLGASALGVRLGIGRLPSGVRLAHIAGAGAIAGIGFTVSLFIADLSFVGSRLAEAKVAVLIASVLAGTLGVAYLRSLRRRVPASPEEPGGHGSP